MINKSSILKALKKFPKGTHGLKMLILIWVLELQSEHLTYTINEMIKLLSIMTKKHDKWHLQYFQTRTAGKEWAHFI